MMRSTSVAQPDQKRDSLPDWFQRDGGHLVCQAAALEQLAADAHEDSIRWSVTTADAIVLPLSSQSDNPPYSHTSAPGPLAPSGAGVLSRTPLQVGPRKVLL